LDVADVRRGRATAIGYGASLCRAGGLDINGDEIVAPNGDRRLKSEGAAGGNRKVIGAIVLQNKPGAKQTDDVATDGSSPGGTCDLDASNVGSGCAAALATVQVWDGVEGGVETETAYGWPLATAVLKVKGPFAAMGRLSPALS
jgi:hypothetical protein